MSGLWLLVVIGFMVMFLASGIKSVYHTYFSDLAAYFDRGRGVFATSAAIFMLVTGLASPWVGALSDRLGPLKTIFIGSVAAGVAFIALALWSTEIWFFIAVYGLLAAFALAAMTYVPMGILADRLFDQRTKGLGYAIITNGTAVGFIVLSPFWIWLQGQVDWRVAFLGVGLVFLVPASLLLLLAARNHVPKRRADAGNSALVAGTWSAVLTEPRFYILAVGFAGCGATMAFVDVHLIPHWQHLDASRANMGMSLSVLGFFELFSGLVAGWLAIRYSKNWLLAGFYLLRGLATLLLLSSWPWANTFLFAALFGASYLGTVVLTSVYCFELFGERVKGQVFGVLFMIHQTGAFFSAQLGAISYDLTGTYETAVIVLSAVAIFVGFISWAFLPGTQSRDTQVAL